MQKRFALSRFARKTAESFSASQCAKKMLKIYKEACKNKRVSYDLESLVWRKTLRLLKAETSLLFNAAKSMSIGCYQTEDKLEQFVKEMKTI